VTLFIRLKIYGTVRLCARDARACMAQLEASARAGAEAARVRDEDARARDAAARRCASLEAIAAEASAAAAQVRCCDSDCHSGSHKERERGHAQ
jgi:hypothetical protein